MFKYCVWYFIHKKHIINKQIALYAKTFKTRPFFAHITIRHSLDFYEARKIYSQYKNENHNCCFKPFGSPKMSHAKIDNKDFYAIEQPVLINGNVVKGMHLSLAYRIGKEFSPAEIAIISDIPEIYSKDIEISLVDCSSTRPNEWCILSI